MAATVLSTILVLLVTGHTHQVVSKGERKVVDKLHKHKEKE